MREVPFQPDTMQMHGIREDLAPKAARSAGNNGRPKKHRKKKPGFHPGGKKGKLHDELGIDRNKTIPEGILAQAVHSDSPAIARDAKRAETMKGWNHK